ncbi:gastrula zinc finger protein XlCGF26.1-like [Leptopilina boulardi]|uniref:gastrula zinc finger protein XlCGF26.1-like n=1 Tax=Leptopilina boulardi TaxID=63433 RepID=UPI0021F54905|nr:gastrula zinc finger protein XlCGF26.1-like [Leptopilina boulardi]
MFTKVVMNTSNECGNVTVEKATNGKNHSVYIEEWNVEFYRNFPAIYAVEDPMKKQWVCFQCGKRYSWRGSLQNHRRVECQKEPTFTCPVCLRRFKHKHRWQSHAKCMHKLDLI